MNKCFIKNKGFTLIEVIAVLVVIAIISSIVIVRAMNTDSDLVTQIYVIKSHIRYAQSRAMASGDIYGIESTGSTYYLFSPDTGTKIRLPGEELDIVTLSDKGVDSMDIFKISFEPVTAGDGNKYQVGWPYWNGSLLGGNETRSIKVGTQNNAITIIGVTGYVP